MFGCFDKILDCHGQTDDFAVSILSVAFMYKCKCVIKLSKYQNHMLVSTRTQTAIICCTDACVTQVKSEYTVKRCHTAGNMYTRLLWTANWVFFSPAW